MPRPPNRLALTAMIPLILAACPGPQGPIVPVNTGDSTAPEVFAVETLGRKGGDLRVTPTSGPVSGSLAADESMQVVARVDDPEGVKEVTIWEGAKQTCVDAAGDATSEGSLDGQAAVTSTDSGGAATTTAQRTASHAVNVAGYTCPAGTRLLSLVLVYWTTGRNYAGTETRSSKLTLTFTSP